jgi:RecJ-like exonuclease
MSDDEDIYDGENAWPERFETLGDDDEDDEDYEEYDEDFVEMEYCRKCDGEGTIWNDNTEEDEECLTCEGRGEVPVYD